MDRKPVGLFAFGQSPIEQMPPMRTRALLAEAALQGAELMLFSAADCDPDDGTVLASLWTASGWQRRRVPLPGLVMIVTNPITEAHHRVDKWLHDATRVIAYRGGPNKLEQVRLFEGSSLAGHAIAAAPLSADNLVSEVTDWLTTRGAAVVKPVDGERGSNVHFVFPLGQGWGMQRRGETLQGTLAEIVAALRASIAGRMRYRQFMVQRYIETTHAGHALALRIDVHKAPDGHWGLTRTCARLNVMGGLATNMAGGGAQMLIEKLLAHRTARAVDVIYDEAVALACRAAELIDRRPTASIIELGVDLALDAHDHLWIMETNVQPEANWAEQDRAVHIIAYALAVAPASGRHRPGPTSSQMPARSDENLPETTSGAKIA